MKRNYLKFVATVLFFVFLFSSFFTLTVGATDEDNVAPTFLNTPASFYFSALKTNFGNNSRQSCGYISVSMLLSFYDSYWNGDIVPDDYNMAGNYSISSNAISVTSSPGIKKDPWPIMGLNFSYDQVISNFSNQFLHLELLRIGRDVLEFLPTSIPTDPSADDDEDFRWFINDEMQISLLNYYFRDYLSLRDSEGTTDYVTIGYDTYENYVVSYPFDPSVYDPDSLVRETIIEKIRSGIPVIYNANPTTGSGHSFVAYDYDEENDAIYLHMGQPADTMHNIDTFYVSDKDPNFVYTENISCIWLEIDESKLLHKHSLFYENSNDESEHCMCEFHEQIVHNHVGEYDNTGLLTDTHNLICNWCGVVTENHSVSSYARYTKTKHKTFCECGVMTGLAFHIVPAGGIGIKICIH